MRYLASTRLTLIGFAALGLALVGRQFSVAGASWIVVMLLSALAINLAAALAVTPRLRKEPGLLIFHAALLALMLLAAAGRLAHFDGHVEVTEGNLFSADDVVVDSKGPLHPDRLRQVAFRQGRFRVDYAPGVKRAATRSEVTVPAESVVELHHVGDDMPLLASGYRFYTTHNKGVAVVLTWLPENGEPVTGAVHMPSYPLFDWKQANQWRAPGGPDIRFWLHLETRIPENRAWTLESESASGVLVVNADGTRLELKPGERAALTGGELRFEELRGWMGYRIFFDPTLPWLLVAAILAVCGLALQFFGRAIRWEFDGASDSCPVEGAP